MASLTPAEKYNIISRNLQEVLGKDQIESILAERDLNIYWGTGKALLFFFIPRRRKNDTKSPLWTGKQEEQGRKWNMRATRLHLAQFLRQ